MGRVLHYNSIFNCMDAEETAGVLDFLIGESARPLKCRGASGGDLTKSAQDRRRL